MIGDETPGVVLAAFWVGNDLSGIPAQSARAMVVDDARAKREAAEAEAQRAEVWEARSFWARHAGTDTSMSGILGRAERAAAVADSRARQDERRALADAGLIELLDEAPAPVAAQRAEDRAHEYGEDRAARQMRENRHWMNMYRARHDYPAAVEAARDKAVQRSGSPPATHCSGCGALLDWCSCPVGAR